MLVHFRIVGSLAIAISVAACHTTGSVSPQTASHEGGVARPALGKARFAYVGAYTRTHPLMMFSDEATKNPTSGISVFRVDASGDLQQVGKATSANPSFIVLHPSQRFLYAVNEVDDYEGKAAGSVEAFSVNADTGMLTLINRQPAGSLPTHLAVDPRGKYVVVASYQGGSYHVFPLRADGGLEQESQRVVQPTGPQQEAHPHQVVFDRSGKYVVATDCGLAKVEVFGFEQGKLTRRSGLSFEADSRPRHVVFNQEEKLLYVLQESKGWIAVVPYNAASGTLGKPIQEVPIIAGQNEGFAAEIILHPQGRFLYASTRPASETNPSAIVTFRVDPATGHLSAVQKINENLDWTRAIMLSPSADWLYALNQMSDSILRYRVNEATGELTQGKLDEKTSAPITINFFVDPAK